MNFIIYFMLCENANILFNYAGYEVNHIWGEGAHDGGLGGQVFPDAMRWLWKDPGKLKFPPSISTDGTSPRKVSEAFSWCRATPNNQNVLFLPL